MTHETRAPCSFDSASVPLTYCVALLLLWTVPQNPACAQGVVLEQSWRVVAPGLELGRFKVNRAAPSGDSTIIILRASPTRWALRLLMRSQTQESRNLSVQRWLETYDLTAAINAGMYGTDYTTHVGYLRVGRHVNNANINRYRSAAAFAPKREDLPPFRIFDLDVTPMDTVRARYQAVVQNLRLIKRPGENRWRPQNRRWSEAALGEDAEGRILFIFCRSPYAMHAFNELLLALPIDVVAAQHLEGGPEAQLVVRDVSHGATLTWSGHPRSGFMSASAPKDTWPVPNVLGLFPRP